MSKIGLEWSTAKERNINRSYTGMSNLISSLSDSQEKWRHSERTPGLPWTRHIYSGGEGATERVRAERTFTQELQQGIKNVPYVFVFQSMIPFPVVVILKLKTFDWCARQQRLQTPQVTNTARAMPGKAIETVLTSQNHGWALRSAPN